MCVGQERAHACQAPHVLVEAACIAGLLGFFWAEFGHLEFIFVDGTLLRSVCGRKIKHLSCHRIQVALPKEAIQKE